jgi:hypothetical protein
MDDFIMFRGITMPVYSSSPLSITAEPTQLESVPTPTEHEPTQEVESATLLDNPLFMTPSIEDTPQPLQRCNQDATPKEGFCTPLLQIRTQNADMPPPLQRCDQDVPVKRARSDRFVFRYERPIRGEGRDSSDTHRPVRFIEYTPIPLGDSLSDDEIQVVGLQDLTVAPTGKRKPN